MTALERTLLSILLIVGYQALSDCTAGAAENFGSSGSRLAPCPDTPNCVSSLADGGYHAIAPIACSGTQEAIFQRLKSVIEKMKRSRLVVASGGYLHAEFRTFLGFIDDVEFFIDEELSLVQMRSASRVGYWD
jgi:uncharacterized protein (DUF1499 family)